MLLNKGAKIKKVFSFCKYASGILLYPLMSHFLIGVLSSREDKQLKCESDIVPVDQLLSFLEYVCVHTEH